MSLDCATKSKADDICEPIGEAEIELYFELATSLDDGEAMALAIAKTRQWILATDDRKATTIAEKMKVKLVSTPELVKNWSEPRRGDKKRNPRSLVKDPAARPVFPKRPKPVARLVVRDHRI